MSEALPRYGVQLVGGGWDKWVVFDRTKGYYASALSTANWVARFRDDLEGQAAAMKKADELNRENLVDAPATDAVDSRCN